MNLPSFARCPPHADLFGWTARTLLAAAADRLPDLSGITLILPNAASIAALRRALLREAGRPLLGPDLTTLDGLIRRGADRAPLSALDGRLLLTELLTQKRHPFGAQDPWRLAAELFNVFEELSANTPELAADETNFLARIERGYGLKPPAALSNEAAVVHHLWRAYLQDTLDRSPAVSRLTNLQRTLTARQSHQTLLFVGCDDLSAAMLTALSLHLGQDVHLWVQSDADNPRYAARLGAPQIAEWPLTPQAAALARAFDAAPCDPRERRSVTPLPCTTIAARHAEHEARVVDLAIREAWLSGVRDIVVVTEDRRLARRVRALLERAGMGLRDEVGWALSTSAAAASLGHWLDCVEKNFPYRATLALLKSAFFDSDSDEIAALEQWIYAKHIAGNVISLQSEAHLPIALLRRLEQAAREVPTVQSQPRKAGDWSRALLRSLQTLPLWERWTQDDAGNGLVRCLQDLDTALQASKLHCSWHEFRVLLESLIEQNTFMPQGDADGVRLMTLQQTTGLRCEKLIIAGASAAQFPGRASTQGLFKHEVRAELGLPHWTRQLALQRSRFITLLHAAQDVLITYAPEEKQEHAIPCPWVQWLQALELTQTDYALALRAASADCEITAHEAFTLNPPPQAAAVSPSMLLPAQWSASAHQTLIECPYRFYAHYALALNAREAPDQGPDARIFGERLHLILQAFHQQMPGLPAPFDGTFDHAHLPQIEACLRRLAAAVFAQDLRQRALARVWVARFERIVAELAQWLCERASGWPAIEVEKKAERTVANNLHLDGKIDRLESNAQNEHRVVDYKSGKVPHIDEMRSGENVQAVHYALLKEQVVQVEYLDLKFERKQTALGDAALADVSMKVVQRLSNVVQQLHGGKALPANGTEKACEHCDYSGLCRKGGWRE